VAKAIELVMWCVANWDQIAEGVLAVVGGASAAIVALGKLAGLLAKLFPSMAPAEGKLRGVAGALDSVAKSGVLNKVALNPKPLAAHLVGLKLASSSSEVKTPFNQQ
jgi:hypothetical protein